MSIQGHKNHERQKRNHLRIRLTAIPSLDILPMSIWQLTLLCLFIRGPWTLLMWEHNLKNIILIACWRLSPLVWSACLMLTVCFTFFNFFKQKAKKEGERSGRICHKWGLLNIRSHWVSRKNPASHSQLVSNVKACVWPASQHHCFNLFLCGANFVVEYVETHFILFSKSFISHNRARLCYSYIGIYVRQSWPSWSTIPNYML